MNGPQICKAAVDAGWSGGFTPSGKREIIDTLCWSVPSTWKTFLTSWGQLRMELLLVMLKSGDQFEFAVELKKCLKRNNHRSQSLWPFPTTDNFTQAGIAHAVFHALRKRWRREGSGLAGSRCGRFKAGKEEEGTMPYGNGNNGLDAQARQQAVVRL